VIDWITAVALAVAAGYIVGQHVRIRRLEQTVGDIATGKVKVHVDGDDIHVRKLGE
jgi:hypothetical protein